MLLGIPTLTRYDLLTRLLDSAERGSLKPSRYVIIDNGGVLERPSQANVEVSRPGRNLGVAASWNKILDCAGNEGAIIANDDVTLGVDTFQQLVKALEGGALFVECGLGWSLFGQSADCTQRVGRYDEMFYPAYYEDNDYALRMRRAGVERVLVRSNAEHVGSATLATASNGKPIDTESRAYYLSKWGGLPGQERYSQPFGNSPQSTRTITVVVQAAAQPRPGWEQVRSAIERSDIGTQYEIMFQAPGTAMRDHCLAVLDRLAQANTDLVLRLEDDVDVNRYILYNLSTWPELDDGRFGMGWAFDPGGSSFTSYERKWRKVPKKSRWSDRVLAYSLGTLMHRKDVGWIREGCARWFAKHNSSDQDIALSNAVREAGKQVCIHAPSLLEHRIDLPSLLGHKHNGNRAAHSDGSFFKTWRRGDPVIDQYGRIVQRP